MTQPTFNFNSDFGARYDQFVRTTIFGYDQLFSMILAFLKTRLGPQADVLVVGSGTGAELVAFGKGMPQWRFTGIDPAEQMVNQCRAKLEREGLTERVDLRVGYLEDLPDDERYDAATLVLVMHFLPDDGAKLSLLNGIARRLKPGGSFILVDHHGETQTATFRHRMAAWINYDILMGLPPEQAEKIPVEASKTHHFIPEVRTLELLVEAGFTNIERIYGAFVTGGWLAQKG